MTEPGPKELLTPQEAAALLQVSVDNVFLMLEDGHLPGQHTGNTWRIRRIDLERFFTNQSDPGSSLEENIHESATNVHRRE